MREEECKRFHRRRCSFVGPRHGPSVIMALIADERCAAACESHVKYGALDEGYKYVMLREVGGGG